ncbi:hypothetical protein BDV38DRAFT_273173 [Aspergillus pseudotamarii]|uniref:Uncharacterized protein n=1 Tax=Aspergillus pseudotamarii TaxID=132259 RepID=A0A5N6SJU2_ASPPS|nr:uncharacterized protein BDV38DRAFT_273173 [Aspergillus pseudotamarii]KAE8134962.1 hypothetical protein BDV38DRAFT_273173 [Aspergillus pseudotamarii]
MLNSEVYGPVKNNTSSDTLISNILTASEITTTPKTSWEIAIREYSRLFIRAQCSMTRVLMENFYFNLEVSKSKGPGFMASPRELKYTIGGNRYRTRVEGAAIVEPRAQYLPIISFTGGLENQTWNEFLTRNLSILRTGFEDQEVFIVGLITRVHAEGYSEHEAFSLKFTRGYNLCFMEDWLDAIRVLSRLIRYIISGKAKVGAVQVNM